MLLRAEADGGHGDQTVSDWKIELDSESGPGATQTDHRFADHRVRVEHFDVGDLIEATVEVTAKVGQDAAGEILVLNRQLGPRDI